MIEALWGAEVVEYKDIRLIGGCWIGVIMFCGYKGKLRRTRKWTGRGRAG